MNVVLLAAGFGTRLAALIGDRPKALIELGGVTLLDHILARVRALDGVARVVLVSNARFAGHFDAWRCESEARDVEVLNDGALDATSRLGAIGDLRFVLDHIGDAAPLLVLGTDTLLGFPLAPMVALAGSTDGSVVAVRENPDAADRSRRGNARLGADGRVLEFVEKPAVPVSPYSAAPFYLFQRGVGARIEAYLAAGGDPDAPGHFLAWLHARTPVYGWAHEGPLLDVGNPESYADAQRRIAEDPERYGVLRP